MVPSGRLVSRGDVDMTLLFVEPGASWSTADVAAGLRLGLTQHGVHLVRYRLDTRLVRSQRWLTYNWRRAKRMQPMLEKPTLADVFYQAGIGALEMALRHQVDLVFVVSGMFLHPDVVTIMKRAGLRVVVLFTESPYDLEHELRMAARVDGCWTTERSVVPQFQAVNRRSGYLRHAWHPERHQPGPQAGDEAVPAHDVVFIGSGFPERVAWLSAIDWRGIDLGLYGAWHGISQRHLLKPYVRGGIIDNRQTAALYRRARVGLNLYRVGPHAESLNPRAYELARCGAFHLSSARAEVSELFGPLVPTCTTPLEAGALIRAWLPDDDRRAEVAAALPRHVASDSWVERSAQVIGDLQTLLGARAA
jgi:spore maturation protein CgeB